MSNTQNMFDLLSDNESGDEAPRQTQKTIKSKGRKEDNSSNYQDAAKARKTTNKYARKDSNQQPARRGRSKDRHSGMTHSGVKKDNYRKQGHGSRNVGTVRDELKGRTQDREVEEEEVEEVEEEEQDTTVTVDQYFAQKGANLDDVLEGKSQSANRGKVDEAQLKKDKLEVVQKKPELKPAFETKQSKGAYKPAISNETQNLVSFKTGFREQKIQKKRVVKQEDAPTEQQEGEQKEGEQQGEQKERRQNNRGPRNDNRGPRENRGPRNDNRNRKPKQTKGFAAEEQDFPKLG